MPTKYNRRRQRNRSRKSKKVRKQRGGVSVNTIRLLRDEYGDRPLAPDIKELYDFSVNNSSIITEPFHEVVTYIKEEIFHTLLSRPRVPEGITPEMLQEFQAEIRRLAELGRPPR
jgi:hypothetical protein